MCGVNFTCSMNILSDMYFHILYDSKFCQTLTKNLSNCNFYTPPPKKKPKKPSKQQQQNLFKSFEQLE